MISKTIGYNGVHNIFRHTHVVTLHCPYATRYVPMPAFAEDVSELPVWVLCSAGSVEQMSCCFPRYIGWISNNMKSINQYIILEIFAINLRNQRWINVFGLAWLWFFGYLFELNVDTHIEKETFSSRETQPVMRQQLHLSSGPNLYSVENNMMFQYCVPVFCWFSAWCNVLVVILIKKKEKQLMDEISTDVGRILSHYSQGLFFSRVVPLAHLQF